MEGVLAEPQLSWANMLAKVCMNQESGNRNVAPKDGVPFHRAINHVSKPSIDRVKWAGVVPEAGVLGCAIRSASAWGVSEKFERLGEELPFANVMAARIEVVDSDSSERSILPLAVKPGVELTPTSWSWERGSMIEVL